MPKSGRKRESASKNDGSRQAKRSRRQSSTPSKTQPGKVETTVVETSPGKSNQHESAPAAAKNRKKGQTLWKEGQTSISTERSEPRTRLQHRLCQPIISTYPMEKKPRGLAVIINNYKFKGMKNREGTQYDRDNLAKLFRKLHFNVESLNDLSASDMKQTIQECRDRDHSNFDCFVCCVLSHGMQGGVYGVDGNIVDIKELTNPVSAIECKSLAGKPKLLFIQACQGPMHMENVEPDSTDAPFDNNVVPNEVDMLVGYSTVQGYVSLRNRENGSYYIQELVDQLQQHADDLDLLSILTNVTLKVSALKKNRSTQVPALVSTLRKRVYLKS